MASGLPDFVVVGAMRSGTSTLFRYLDDHPDVHMAQGKEVHFFDLRYERGLDWYRAKFASAPAGAVLGEATPNYLYRPVALQRLQSDVPGVRTLVTLRHPVDRAYSHYQMHLARRREQRTWEEIVDDELMHERDRGYLDRSRYGRQLTVLRDLFGPERILVLAFEELRDLPDAFFGKVHRYLGIDGEPPDTSRTVNAYFRIRSQRLRRVTTKGRLLPAFVRTGLARVNQSEEHYTPMSASIRRRLSLHFAEDTRVAITLAGWDDDPWEITAGSIGQ